jgi:hypothetical protein
MKIIKMSFLTIAVMLFFACNDQLQQDVSFDFTVASDSSMWSGDTLVVKKNMPIEFTFSGNAEIITFYNGQKGNEYSKRNSTQTPVDEIDSCYLTFTNRPQFGNIPGTLKVYLSTTFNGLTMKDKKVDSLNILNENWIDLTELSNISNTSNVTNNSKISLMNYISSKMTLAFQYLTTDNSVIQPTWQIGNLRITVRDKKGIITTFSANDIGFNAFDMLKTTSPYSGAGGAGTWDLNSVSSSNSIIRIVFSSVGQAVNNDWLISNSKPFTTRIPDVGFAVKGLSNQVNVFKYSFDKPGVYNIGFQAINQNYSWYSETGKTMIVKVK